MQIFDIFIFKPIIPYFEITNTLGYLAILVRRHQCFFQVASESKPLFQSEKRNIIEIWSPIQLLFLCYLSFINRFCLKNKTMTLFYKLSGVVHHFDFMMS